MVESVVKDLLDTMIKLTLDGGATRRFGDYFVVRLDMRGSFDGYPWRQGVNAGQDDSKRTTTSVRQQGKTASVQQQGKTASVQQQGKTASVQQQAYDNKRTTARKDSKERQQAYNNKNCTEK